MDINFEDVQPGDFVRIIPDRLSSFPKGNEGKDLFEVIFPKARAYDYKFYIFIIVKGDTGWNICPEQFSEKEYDEYKDRIDELTTAGATAWSITSSNVVGIVKAGAKVSAKTEPGVYNPLTSTAKSSKEELEQYKKDFEFFFRDLSKPYVPPENAWSKWS